MFLSMMILSMILTLMFTSMSHPISMGFILLIQTMLISLMTSFYTYTFWLSYILFLIMIGGMLILFTYVTSIASNEMFMFSNKIMISLALFMTTLLIVFFMDKSMIYQLFKNNDMMNMNNIINFIEDNSIILNKIYNKPNNLISLLLINYLLLTLIIVVKITNMNYGPLRQKF